VGKATTVMGASGKRIVISGHARQRMRQRGATATVTVKVYYHN
jgi:hypothetical protein